MTDEVENKKHEYLIAQLKMLKNEELEKMLFLENFLKYHYITTEQHKEYATRYIQIESCEGETFDFSKVKGKYNNHNFYKKHIYIKILESGQVSIDFETDEDVIKKLNLTLKED